MVRALVKLLNQDMSADPAVIFLTHFVIPVTLKSNVIIAMMDFTPMVEAVYNVQTLAKIVLCVMHKNVQTAQRELT